MKPKTDIIIKLEPITGRNQPGMKLIINDLNYVLDAIQLLRDDTKHISNTIKYSGPGVSTTLNPVSQRTLGAQTYRVDLQPGFYVHEYADQLAESLRTSLGCTVEVVEVEPSENS